MRIRNLLTAFVFFSLNNAWAEPVWYCSRSVAENVDQTHQQSLEFSIASVSGATDVIGVSVRDLINVLSGVPVRLAGQPLAVCFWPAQEAVESNMMSTLGINPSSVLSLARRNSILENPIYLVADPLEMSQCISDHSPAIGQISEPFTSDKIGPCF